MDARRLVEQVLTGATPAQVLAEGQLTAQHVGPSPLKYTRGGRIERIVLRDSDAPPPHKHDTYFAEKTKLNWYGVSGRRLKKGRPETIPGSGPMDVGFLDYHMMSATQVYVDYVKTRRDYTRMGVMSKLLDALFAVNPAATLFHFGKVMSPHVWRYMDKRKAMRASDPSQPEVIGGRDF
jgi:hypothetical protein